MPKPLNQKGSPTSEAGLTPVLLLFIAAIGILIVLGVSSTFSFKDNLFNAFFPKPASHAAPALPDAPEASYTMELEKNPDSPFPDDTLPDYIESGKNFRVDIYARSDLDSANLFVSQLNFPKDTIEVVEVNKREGNTLVKQWIEGSFDNNTGTISMVGAIPNPGVKTETKTNYLFASIIFKAKKTGNVQLTFNDKSGVFKNSDNSNMITESKYLRGIGFDIKDTPAQTAAPTQAPTIAPTTVPTQAPTTQPTTTPVVTAAPTQAPTTPPAPAPTATPTTSPAVIQTACSDITIIGATLTKNQGGQSIYVMDSQKTAEFTLSSSAENGISISWQTSLGQYIQDSSNTLSSKYTAPTVANDQTITATATIKKGTATKDCAFELLVQKPVAPVTIKAADTGKPLKRDGDINSDGKFDYVDLSALLSQFNPGKSDAYSEADLNSDKTVNTFDLLKLREVLTEKKVLGSFGGSGGGNAASGGSGSGGVSEIQITKCQEITKAGNYVLNQDIRAVREDVATYSTTGLDKNYCIYIHDVSNVNIDCKNHQLIGHLRPANASGPEDQPIGPIKFANVNGFSMKSCTLVDAGPGSIYTIIRDSNNGIARDNVLKNAILSISGGGDIKVINNKVSGGIWFGDIKNSEISGNAFEGSIVPLSSIVLHNVSDMKVLNNKIDGRSTYGISFQGTQGITMSGVSSLVHIEGNRVGNIMAHALILPDTLKNSKIINNKFTNVRIAIMSPRVGNNASANNSVLPPITVLEGNVISGNVVDKSDYLYAVMHNFVSQGGVGTTNLNQDSDIIAIYGKNNTFTNNSFTNKGQSQAPVPVD